jgi:hypothetical protein
MSWWEREFWGKSLSSRLPQTYTPTIVKVGSLGFTSTTIVRARYWRIPFVGLAWVNVVVSGTTSDDGGGLGITTIGITPPINAALDGQCLATTVVDGSSQGGGSWFQTTSQIYVRKPDGGNWGIGAGRVIRVSGLYEVA